MPTKTLTFRVGILNANHLKKDVNIFVILAAGKINV